MSALSSETKAKIEGILSTDRVVLFMKGTRQQPRCGFSATVVEILDELLPNYVAIDVLADPDIREGIKVYGEWPTIPQLYVKGELVGGADIVKDLTATGELHALLGVEKKAAPSVTITITDAAAAVLREARAAEPADQQFLRVSVSPRFQHGLSFGPALPGDVVTEASGLTVRIDPQSAKRANGLHIDYVSGAQTGFRLDNPNEPPRVKLISVKDLKARSDAAAKDGPPLRLYDVRTFDEWQTARIAGAILVNDGVRDEIAALPKDTVLYFHCHHGGRSQAAAEHWLKQGFKTVYNVEGGIDAWSQLVDNKVPRY